jgi:hypothetical protein
MLPLKTIITIFAVSYKFIVEIRDFINQLNNASNNKYYNIYLYLRVMIEIISSMLFAYYRAWTFIAMVGFNIIFGILVIKIERLFWEKMDEIKKLRIKDYK